MRMHLSKRMRMTAAALICLLAALMLLWALWLWRSGARRRTFDGAVFVYRPAAERGVEHV